MLGAAAGPGAAAGRGSADGRHGPTGGAATAVREPMGANGAAEGRVPRNPGTPLRRVLLPRRAMCASPSSAPVSAGSARGSGCGRQA